MYYLVIMLRLVFILSFLLASSFAQLSDIKVMSLETTNALTFSSEKLTNGRRLVPKPQLQCIGGLAEDHAFKISNIKCYKNEFFEWSCVIPKNCCNNYKLGDFEIKCEGLDSLTDDTVLEDSCYLLYNLDFTDEYYMKKQYDGYNGIVFVSIILLVVSIVLLLYGNNDEYIDN